MYYCQKQTAAAIIDAKADYVITIKRNQKTLCEAIAELFVGFGEDDYKDPKVKCHTTKERSHGREEIREYYVSKVPRQGVFNSWPGIRSVGMVYRKRISNGKTQEETSFFITSMQPKVKVISKFIRDHWKIENSQHYILDVAFAEDASRIRKGTAPDIAAGFRRMALNILQRDTSIKDAIRGKRLRAGWDDNVLLNIFTAFKAA